MFYYEVWVGSHRYHSKKALTYASEQKLQRGLVVTVPLQRLIVPAVILRQINKPSYVTKPISRHISELALINDELLQLLDWLRDYYPAPFGQIVSMVLPATLTKQSRGTNKLTKTKLSESQSPPVLTEEQTLAVRQIKESYPQNILLHGNTGSGKTRVYLELTKHMIDSGKSVIILTPEIGLTPQLVQAFETVFPNQTVVIHSELSDVQRRDSWIRIASASKPLLTIGPRSALFAPLKEVGLIIVDEFHEPAYKQEQAPHYLASRVAAMLASFHKAQLVLGSATPLVSDYFAFEQKKLPIVKMEKSAITHNFGDTKLTLVDRTDRSQFSRSASVSDALISAIQEAHVKKQQSLVFLNRRGTARLVLCKVCGWQAHCPHCDLPLTYHGDKYSLRCHTCGYNTKPLTECPSCTSHDIVYRNPGTKALVEEFERLLPGLQVVRFDSDSTANERLEKQYDDIRAGSADILVGTQMLGKGLDLPKLSVVGIINADTSLTFPDYTAEERTFQLVTQAIGRINRGHLPGTAVIQTFQPENSTIQAALSNDYRKFYDKQLEERKAFGFPPFRFTLKLTCVRASEVSAKKASEELFSLLQRSGEKIEVSNPMPAFISKSQGKYRWQIIIKAMDRALLLKIINGLPSNCSYDIDPMNLL